MGSDGLRTWETDNWDQQLGVVIVNLPKHPCRSPRKHQKLDLLSCAAPVDQYTRHKVTEAADEKK